MMVSQIDLIAAITKYLDKQGIETMVPRHFNAVISAANSIIDEIEKPVVMASPGMGLNAWLNSDDTGISSLWMAAVLSGGTSTYGHPRDVDDFCRCMRLLEAVPEFASRLDELRGRSDEWDALLDRWGAITDRIIARDYDPADAYINEAISGVRAAQ